MIKHKNHILYWIFIPLVLLTGIILNVPLNILVHDAYYVSDSIQISMLFSILFFFTGLGYFIFRKINVNETLLKFHNWLTIIGVLIMLIFVGLQYFVDRNSSQGEFEEYKNIGWKIQIYIGQLIGIALIFTGFLIYLVNMIITIKKIVINKK